MNIFLFLAGKCTCKEDCIKTGKCTCDSSCQCNKASKFIYLNHFYFTLWLFLILKVKDVANKDANVRTVNVHLDHVNVENKNEQQIIEEQF